MTSADPDLPDSMRVDKWLWHARFFKTRGLATKQVQGGHLRVNASRVRRPAHLVRPGDTLTFIQARRPRVVRILAMSQRRGPASEARILYHDLAPDTASPPGAPKYEGKGRPSGKDRRRHLKSRLSPLD